MNKAAIGQWRDLYEIALDIKRLKPWEKVSDTCIISVNSKNTDEMYYFNFMGKNSRSFGISCFIGLEGLYGYLDLMRSGEELFSELIFVQRSLVAYFGTQKDISEDDLALIKALNLNFISDGEWLYFRSFEPGYAPWPLDQEEVTALTEAYGQLILALKAMFEDNLKVDFESGQTLARWYDHDNEVWINEVKPFEYPPRQYESISINDELMIARILKRPLVDARLELDVFSLLVPVDDEEYKKPFYPVMALLADSISGRIVEFEMFTPEDNEIEHVIALIMGFIEKHGRPLIIYVQNQRLKAILDQLCRDTMIPMEMVNFLPAINAFKLEKGIARSVDQSDDE